MPKAQPQIKTPYANTAEALGRRVRAFRRTSNANTGPQSGVIKALDCFAGAGGFSTALLRAARENGLECELTVLNHWSTALETARRNLGAIKVFNCSISDVNPRDVIPDGYLDILLASPECFPAGTLILTDTGLTPIEDLKIGDKVLTHRGRYRRIVAKRRNTAQETVTLRGHGHSALTTTPNHPFYIRTRLKTWNNANRAYDSSFTAPEWVDAQNLTKTSYWAVPTAFPKLPIPKMPGRGMDFDEKFMWLMGRYVGDGSLCNKTSGNEITICCGKHEADELGKRLAAFAPTNSDVKRAGHNELRFRRRDLRTATLFEAGHTNLVTWIEEHFGRRAENKKIPAWAFGMAPALRRALLDGYLSADGCKSSFNAVSANSVSKNLAFGIRFIVESLGYHCSMSTVVTKGTQIEGRSFNSRLQHKVSYYEPLHQAHVQCKDDVRHRWHPVREVAPGPSNVTVYNIQVEEDESYVADGIVVHNCIMFSSARGRKPINDQRRSSCAEVLRFLSDLHVETMVLENVQELSTWGPLDPETHLPIKERKGEFFQAFIKAIKRLGYNVSYQTIVAADHGDPTTRKRLYMIAQKNRPASFPMPTHSKDGRVPDTQPWISARTIINFAIRGDSVFQRRDPHVPKTLRRCAVGFEDQIPKAPLAKAYVQALTMFRTAAEVYHEQMLMKPTESKLGRRLTREERALVRSINDRARSEHRLIVEEMFRKPVAVMEWSDLILHDLPQPTITGEATEATPDPFVCKLYGTGVTQPISEPLDTVTAGGGKYTLTSPVSRPAGSGNIVDITACKNDPAVFTLTNTDPEQILAESFIVTVNHGTSDDDSRRHSSLDAPANVVTSRGADGLVTPEAIAVDGFILRANASDTSSWDDALQPIQKPLRAITTKNNLGFVQAESVIIPQQDFGKLRTRSIDEPIEAITSIARQGIPAPPADVRDGGVAGVHPAIINLKGQSTATSVDAPLPTSTAHARHFGCAVPAADVVPEPIMLPQDQRDRSRRTTEPTTTATTAGAGYLATPEAIIVSRNEQQTETTNRTTTLDETLGTATTRGIGYLAAPEAIIVSRNEQKSDDELRASTLDQTLGTCTASGAGYLAQPTAAAHPMHAPKPDPFIASYYGPKGDNDRAPRSIDEPIATIPTENRFAMVEGVIIPQQNFDDQAVFDSLDRPLRAVQTRNGTGIAEPEAFITPKFGEHGTQVPRTHKLDEPVPTITGHGAGMLVGATTYGVTTPGKPYVIVSGTVIELDILYRMLTNDELARAMSFKTDEYDYVLSGSAAEQTRQIGNAVAVNTAKALISHALEYRFAEARRMVAA